MTPEPANLDEQLGEAARAWANVRAFVDGLAGVTSEWKFYGPKYGWQLKVSFKKRALVYLIPKQGFFTAAFALRADAIAALRDSSPPPDLMLSIDASKASPEGKPARIEVKTTRDVALVKKIARIKLTAL